MGRDPDQGQPFVFDLVEQDTWEPATPLAAPDPAGADPDGAGGPPPTVRDRRRVVMAVAAVLAIAFGTGIASDSVRDGARIERLRDVAGGVEDVTTPLTETWEWDGTVGAAGYLDGTEPVAFGDVLAFRSGTDLVALDPETGTVAWTVPLGDDPACGPLGVSPYEGAPASPASAMVCLGGNGADRAVVTVRPDGVVSAPRPLPSSDTRRYGAARPGPDGTVLRARRVGPTSQIDLADAWCNGDGECRGTVEAGRDVVLRAEDAVTGEERWTVTVPFLEADPGECWSTSWESRDNDVSFDGQLHPDAFSARITADLVNLHGCGVAAAVSPDGVVLAAEQEPRTGSVESFDPGSDAGRYAWYGYRGAARTVLYSADGAVVGDLPGYVHGPRATDGSGPDVLLGTDETGLRLRAYDADGTRRWDVRAESSDQPFVAQVGRTAVVGVGFEDVYGLDLATGAEQWRWDSSEVGTGVLQAFTDGRSVLLVVIQAESGVPVMVSLDAATGEMLWHEGDGSTGDPGEQETGGILVAVNGHLMEIDETGVRGLG